MNPYGAFAIGVGVGVVVTGFALVSMAPNLSERAVLYVVSSTSGDAGVPAPIGAALGIPIARAVRREVARKVAPWAL